VIPLELIEHASVVIDGRVVRTPLVRLETDRDDAEIYLKLECLQPIGSFKLRGALNAMHGAEIENGVVTASAGNMAQGVAYGAREAGVPCTVIVPDTAPQTKLDAIARLGARTIAVPFDRWWQAMDDHEFPGVDGLFVHPFDDDAVIAGNGTVALEVLAELPDPDAVLVPWGGGGLTVGIASAVRALRPETKVYAVEVATGAALAASLQAGKPVAVEYTPSFVDGIGGPTVAPRLFELASAGLVAGSLVVGVEEIAAAVRLLAARARVVAEGAGAAPVAAAERLTGKIVCIVSGGNIDPGVLARILEGRAT
jgi:threonine dehydratase